MTEYLVIGDIHGKTEVVDTVLHDAFKKYTKIFVGDIVDNWDNDTDADMYCVEKILPRLYEDTIWIMGNHDQNYVDHVAWSRGFNSNTMKEIKPFVDQIRKTTCDYFFVDDILITHAGLSAGWIKEETDSVEALIEDGVLDDPNMHGAVGRSRGGMCSEGGIYWCDYQREFRPIPWLRQIFGHSRVNDLTCDEEERNFAIDCLDTVTKGILINEQLEICSAEFK